MPKYNLDEAMRRLREAQAIKDRGLNGQRTGLAMGAIPRAVQVPFRDVLSAPGRALGARAQEEFGPEAAGLTWPQQLGRLAGRGFARMTGAYQGTESPIATNMLNKIGGMPMQPARQRVPMGAPQGVPVQGAGATIPPVGAAEATRPVPVAAERAGLGVSSPWADFAERNRRNAVQFGLQTGVGVDERIASLNAKMQRTRNTADLRRMSGEMSALMAERRAQAEQGRGMAAGAQQIAGDVMVEREKARGLIGAAQYNALANSAKIAAQTQGASSRAIASVIREAIRGGQIDINAEGQLESAVEAIQEGMGGGGQSEQDQMAEGVQGADINQNGVIDPEEMEYNNIKQRMSQYGDKILPADKDRMNLRIKYLKEKLGLVEKA